MIDTINNDDYDIYIDNDTVDKEEDFTSTKTASSKNPSDGA